MTIEINRDLAREAHARPEALALRRVTSIEQAFGRRLLAIKDLKGKGLTATYNGKCLIANFSSIDKLNDDDFLIDVMERIRAFIDPDSTV